MNFSVFILNISITRTLTRRRLLQLLGSLTVTSAATFLYSRLLEPHWVDVESITLQIPRLPERLAGKRIVQISDIHLCEFMQPDQLLTAVQIVNRLQPHWLFLTGDYVGDNAQDAEGLIEPLRQLQVPAFASYGNHDYWSDLPTVQNMLAATPVVTLRNQAVELEAGLWLGGIDDLWSGRPDLAATLREIPPQATTLLLAHEPDFFARVVKQQAPVAVQFSGHTHGGQIRLPTIRPGKDGLYTYAPILPKYGHLYPIGLRQVGEHQVYTNRGLGLWPVPYRLNCRPEITLFTLQPASY